MGDKYSIFSENLTLMCQISFDYALMSQLRLDVSLCILRPPPRRPLAQWYHLIPDEEKDVKMAKAITCV